MALENPIGNPLEPQNRPQFTAEFNTLGPVDDYLGHGGYFLSTPQALSVLAS